MDKQLSFSGQIVRLRKRLRESDWRPLRDRVLLLGKFTGVALIFLIALFMAIPT